MSDEHIDPLDLDALDAAKATLTEAEKLARQIEISDFKWLMAHKQGRRHIWSLLQKHGVYRSSFRTDALEMAFLEGQRNDGLRLLADVLEHAPDRYAEMLKEQRDARSSSSSGGNAGSSGGPGNDDPGNR